MTTRTAKRLFRITVALFLALLGGGLIDFLLALPPDQRKDGLKGIVLALSVMAVGFTTLYRLGRAMEKEEVEQETREAHGQPNEAVH